MTRHRWDRDWKSAALTAAGYLTLLLAGWILWRALGEGWTAFYDHVFSHPNRRSAPFQPPPASPYGWQEYARPRASLCVRDGGHK